MKTLRQQEGWLYLDNRHSQGVPDSTMVPLGLPQGAGHGLKEFPTYTCSHCQVIVVMEPARTRERGFCRKCNSRICDPCNVLRAQNFECKTMQQVIDEVLEATDKAASPITLLTPFQR